MDRTARVAYAARCANIPAPPKKLPAKMLAPRCAARRYNEKRSSLKDGHYKGEAGSLATLGMSEVGGRQAAHCRTKN